MKREFGVTFRLPDDLRQICRIQGTRGECVSDRLATAVEPMEALRTD